MRSKHIGAKQVKAGDVNSGSLGSVFGGGAIGGEVQDFNANVNSGHQRPIALYGRDSDGTSEAFTFLAPTAVTFSDLHFQKGAGVIPAGREITIHINIESTSQELSCTLTSTISSCDTGSAVLRVDEGDLVVARIASQANAAAVVNTDFLFSYRIAP